MVISPLLTLFKVFIVPFSFFHAVVFLKTRYVGKTLYNMTVRIQRFRQRRNKNSYFMSRGAFQTTESDVTWSLQKITANNPWCCFLKWPVCSKVCWVPKHLQTPLFSFLLFWKFKWRKWNFFWTYDRNISSVIWYILENLSLASLCTLIHFLFFYLEVPTLDPHCMWPQYCVIRTFKLWNHSKLRK